MAVPAIIGGLGAVYTTIQGLIGENWTRYILLLAGLGADNVIGTFSGVYLIEGLFSYVISGVFGIEGFIFPIFYGVSSFLLIFVFFPLILYLIPQTQE